MSITQLRSAPKPHRPTSDLSPIQCNVDDLGGLSLRGWAVDLATPTTSPLLHVIVDGQEVAAVICNGERPDVFAASKGPKLAGYEIQLPAALGDGELHWLTMRDLRRREVRMFYQGNSFSSLDFRFEAKPQIRSHVDGLRYGAFEGWVTRTELGKTTPLGNCIVRVACDGVTVGYVRANHHRGDVGRVLSGPSNCGFRFTPPQHIRSAYPRRFQFFLMPEDIELDGSPCQTSLVVDAFEGRLLELVAEVDTVHRDLTRIRRQLREIVPRQRYSIADYDRWFRLYEPALKQRMRDLAPVDGWSAGPLVSIVCPVYKPAFKAFQAAVASVLAQSYRNFELILVDDNSRNEELSAYLNKLVEQDRRVRLITHKRNRGISGATNTALSHARGEWVAFFDHDDLLVEVAIECMVAATYKSGATVLYSDEDKIDESGMFSSPAFKTDWNHRLLLGVNYVCHLLFVRSDVLQAVGPLGSDYDGAQDHDLVFRLAEHVGSGAIHHVPEILYHWRIAPGSTAETMSNKGYATAAGVKAVTDHLIRLNRPARVESIDGQTLYHVSWPLHSEPKVTIIIPYKDEIKTTERCLCAVLDLTQYKNFDVIMVDNWSTTREAEIFRKSYEKNDRVRFLRVEEEFNYSRLNNLAASKTESEFLVFMNNDLFVKDPYWLSFVVGEAATDPEVGAVGGKFFYPDGSVQHGGVVLGIGGVAGHAHVGLQTYDNGYGGRMLFAQEISAVTAAGMLVRASAFQKVGGFDEVRLRIAFNDVDLCLKLGQAGFKVIWTPDFIADHHESLSRGDDERPLQETRFFDEIETMKERWGEALKNDRFYNPKFNLERQPFFDLVDPDYFKET